MSLTGLLILLLVVFLLIACIQQLGAMPGLFASGSSVSQRVASAIVFAILIVLIVWLVSYLVPLNLRT